MTVLLDSCTWIEFFEGTKKGELIRDIIESNESLILSTVNLSEVYRYLISKVSLKEADDDLIFMTKRCFILPLFTAEAILGAKLKYENKMTLGDALIYATSIINKAKLVTFDSGLKHLENVEVY